MSTAVEVFGREWSAPADYADMAAFSAGQWAWEFLRRNTDYHTDWEWFNQTWTALETDYGSPPARDFSRWQQDPRAYRQTTVDDETEQQFIECWMGARYGFYKFPQSPQTEQAPLWREQDDNVVLLDGSEAEYFAANSGFIALGFDIAQPVSAQVEYCKRMLTVLQRQAAQSGKMVVRSVKSQHKQWQGYLRLLDAKACGVSDKEINLAFSDIDINTALSIAEHLSATGYLAIAALDKPTVSG